MSWFQLDAPSLAARARRDASPASVPTLGFSAWYGAVAFAAVSLAGFVPWALFGHQIYERVGEVGLYLICAVTFILCSCWLLPPLLLGRGNRMRFAQLFVVVFGAYAAAWIAGWFMMRGHGGMNTRSVAGLFAGALVMGLLLCVAFDALRRRWLVIVAIFIPNTFGYFLGQLCEAVLAYRGAPEMQAACGRMSWGLFFGLGMGAGLGLAFYLCQAEARRLLAGQSR